MVRLGCPRRPRFPLGHTEGIAGIAASGTAATVGSPQREEWSDDGQSFHSAAGTAEEEPSTGGPEPVPDAAGASDMNRHLPEGLPDPNSRDAEADARMHGTPMATGCTPVGVPTSIGQWYAGATMVPSWGTYQVQGMVQEHMLGPGTAPLSLPQYVPSVAANQHLGVPTQVNGHDQWPTDALTPGARPGIPGERPGTASLEWVTQWSTDALTPGARPGTPGATPGTAWLGWVTQPGNDPGTCAAPGARPGNAAPTLGVTPGATSGTPPIIEQYILDPEGAGPPRRQLVLDC